MTRINAYLVFDGNCREAMTFYQRSVGGKLTMQTVKESPMAEQWPAEVQQHILRAALQKDHLLLLASDMAGPEGTVKGNNICLALACNSRKEIEQFFSRLAEGGKVNHPLHEFFDGVIGGITDKFGITWVLKL